MICKDCDYVGRPTYDYPCSRCDMTAGSTFCMYEHKEKPTNADKIRAMTDRELAEWIYNKAMLSESVCCYCEHYHKITCNEGPCQNMTDIKIIMAWLQQPVEE